MYIFTLAKAKTFMIFKQTNFKLYWKSPKPELFGE